MRYCSGLEDNFHCRELQLRTEWPNVARYTNAIPGTNIRWDRLGRYALVAIFLGICYLYIKPICSWVGAYGESKKRGQELAVLKAEHARLAKQSQQLKRATSVEAEARKMGMVKAGERAFVVKGLPDD